MISEVIQIFGDGSSRGNPGPSGWGAIIKYKQDTIELSGAYRLSTNNRVELISIIEALTYIKEEGVNIHIYSDSKYVIDSVVKKWVFNWEGDNFENRVNSDLWQKFLILYRKFNIKMIWVKGHATNINNNRCDTIATCASSNDNCKNWLIDYEYEKMKK